MDIIKKCKRANKVFFKRLKGDDGQDWINADLPIRIDGLIHTGNILIFIIKIST